jgi:hypothetical protein
MSPELKDLYLNKTYSLNNNYNPYKSDLYSLGLCFVEMCSLKLIKNEKQFSIEE